MDNLVFNGRGDCLLGCHSSRGGGGGGLDESDPARAAAKETNGWCWQKKKQNQTKENKQANDPNKKLEKNDKEHMVEIK